MLTLTNLLPNPTNKSVPGPIGPGAYCLSAQQDEDVDTSVHGMTPLDSTW